MSADTILGIDPGTRFIGISVVRDCKVIHYQIKSFPGIWSQKKLYTIIKMLSIAMERYRITKVAVKIPDVLPCSLGFTQVIGSLNVLCESNGIQMRYYTLSEIKAQYCKGKVNSKELMAAIALKHTDLIPEYQRERRNKEGYYYKIFEAVAVAQMKWR